MSMPEGSKERKEVNKMDRYALPFIRDVREYNEENNSEDFDGNEILEAFTRNINTPKN